MFELGFLGTRAPMYMDIVTLYFALLPFLLFISIRFAIKKNISAHYKSQVATYLLTLVMVVVFEVGVRFDGGYLHYIEGTNISTSFLNSYLIIHIVIALVSVVAWSILLFNSYKTFHKTNTFEASKHRIRARLVTLGLFITSFMGVSIYYFLFVA